MRRPPTGCQRGGGGKVDVLHQVGGGGRNHPRRQKVGVGGEK